MNRAAVMLTVFLSLAFAAPEDKSRKPDRIILQRYFDQTEGAFLVLVPKGWMTRGGILRVNPNAVGGAGQSIAAKLDFAIMREPAGQAIIRWLPQINYAQPSPYNAMLGGNWNGMPVVPMPSPQDYLTRILFPNLHPQARGTKIVEVKPRPDVAAAIRLLPVAQTMLSQGASYHVDSSSVTVTYEENGMRYKEILFTAIEGYSLGAALWSNPFTIAARTPEAEYDGYGPVALVVINSFALNPLWMTAEAQGQIQRGRTVKATMDELARIDAAIADNRAKVMSQISSGQYLSLTSQERFVNPYNGREELGSNEWKYRWQNASGEVVYTDDANWDPSQQPGLSGYKLSQIKRIK